MSCAVSCSTAEFARPALKTRNAPIRSAQTPATRRSFAERVTEDVAETAMTTSVQAAGRPPRGGRHALIGWQVSWLAASGAFHPRGTLAFPGGGIAKGGRFLDREASSPGSSQRHPSGFSGRSSASSLRHHCPLRVLHAPPDGCPSLLYSRGVGRDCSALLGSAASHSHLLPGPFPDPGTIQYQR